MENSCRLRCYFVFVLLLTTCWFLTALSQRAAAQSCFISAPGIWAGKNPISVAVADFNGDGRPDMVVANPPGQTVTVLLGNGQGQFEVKPVNAFAFQPWFVAVADFNGDGKLDIAVGDYTWCVPSVVWILLGNGDGTFQPAVSYSVDKTPVSLAVGDFNGDGIPDLAAANSCSSDVSVLIGRGDGTFLPAVNYAVSSPASVIVGDFNQDGKADLAVAGTGGEISYLRGNGDGTFRPAKNFSIGTGLIPTAIATADLNGDGHLDLVVPTIYGSVLNEGTVNVMLGNGDGTFQTPVVYSSGENSEAVTITDLNGDGIPDLAVATLNSDGVNIFFGNGDGSFRNGGQYTSGDGSMSISAADFNGDGIPDLVTANNGIGTTANGNPSIGSVSLLLGVGNGKFQTARNYVAGYKASFVATADFNHDGKPDLVVGQPNGYVDILLGQGGATFGPVTAYKANSVSAVATGDFNGDGNPDIVAASSQADEVMVFLGDGRGNFGSAISTPAGTNPSAVVSGDFNHDGIPDLAVTNNPLRSSGTVTILIGKGDGTFQSAGSMTVGFNPRDITAGDFNRDGKLDLAVVNYDTQNVSILLGNGDGTFQPATNYSAGLTPRSVAVGDFNHDGKLDLAIANLKGNSVSILLGNGDGSFGQPVAYAVAYGPLFLRVADINGDGNDDVVAALSYSGEHGNGSVALLLGNGDGSLQKPTIYGTGLIPRTLAIADFNGDGALDIATSNESSNSVTILLNSKGGSLR